MLSPYVLMNEAKRKMLLACLLITVLLMVISCNRSNTADEVRKLEKLKQAYLWNSHSKEGKSYLYKLEEEALLQQNPRYAATAYFYLSTYYMVNLDSTGRDSAFYTIEKAIEYYREAEYETGRILAEVRKIELLIEENSFELALENASQLLVDAQRAEDPYMIATVYRAFTFIYLYYNRMEDALDAANLASEAYRSVDEFEDVLPEYNYLILLKVAITNLMQENELSLSYCDEYMNSIEKEKISDFAKKERGHLVDMYIAANLVDLDRLDKAEVLIEKSRNYIESRKPGNKRLQTVLNLLFASYYLKKHEYTKALHYIELIDMDFLVYIDLITVLNKKIEILKAKGDYLGALEVKDELSQYEDMLYRKSTLTQLEKLKHTLQLEQQAAKSKVEMKYIRIIILLLSVICISLVVIFCIKLYGVKKLRRKNELIFTQYRNLDKYTHKPDSLGDSTEKQPDTDPASDLFKKAEEYLYSTEAFRNTNITREYLAAELGTNRQYLTEAIQKNRSLTFMEYINEMRLDYARRLLCYNLEFSIDEVYIESGFNSKSTFYRLFKQKYDMTPKEVREIAVKDIHISN